MKTIDEEIAAIMELADKEIKFLEKWGETNPDKFIAERTLVKCAQIIQRLQAELAERDRLLNECEELLSRFDVSVLTPISRSMYSDLMYKLITTPTEE